MTPLRSILVVVDPTADTQPAAAKAARLARASGARLHVAVCDYEAAFGADPFFDSDRLQLLREAFIDERKVRAGKIAAPLSTGGLEVEASAHWGHPLHRAVLDLAGRLKPDLVVKDTHFHSALRRTILTNTDWHLIRECTLPLLLVKPEPWKEEPRVVAALDPGRAGDKPAELDRRILDLAAGVAGLMGGELYAVHAFWPAALIAATTPVGVLPAPPGMGTLEIVEMERQRLQRALAQLAGALAVPPRRMHFEEGTPVEVLPRLAGDLGADIVAMGAISRSRLRELVVGSTAERILDRLPCDVLVVKPKGADA